MKNALEKKHYYFLILRDMKWKFSPKKVDPVFWGNPVNLK